MSSNKYVPPHMRNKREQQQEQRPRYQNNRSYEKPRWQVLEEQEEATRKEKQEQGLEDNEQNFPALSTAAPKATFTKKSFAEIAVAGHEKSEQEAMKKSIEQKYLNRQFNIPLPVFHPSGHFVEPEDEGYVDEPKKQKDEDGWVTVDRKKYRKPNTVEELAEEEQKQTEEENTVWYDQESHETCWDERY